MDKRTKLLAQLERLNEQLFDEERKARIGKCFVKRVNYYELKYVAYYRVTGYKGFDGQGRITYTCKCAYFGEKHNFVTDAHEIREDLLIEMEEITVEHFRTNWNGLLKQLKL